MSEFNIQWLAKHLSGKPTVILDVGTYDGGDAVRLKQANPGARVIAFEACPDAHAAIVSRGLVVKAGVEVVHFAVSDKDGEMDFHSNTDARNQNLGCSGSILEPTPHNFAKYPFLKFRSARKVKTTRLDTFCAANGIDHIDVVHMDVQGAEGFAIDGLGKLRPTMLFFEIDATDEYKGAVPLTELFGKLAAWGYEKKWQGAHDALFVRREPNALDGLTVCITNWHRPKFLARALQSCRDAGIRRVTIACCDPDDAVLAVIEEYRYGWLSFDVARVDDVGCNSAWVLACYRSRTKRVIVLHDDDVLLPEFGKAYRELIAPALDKGAGWASWRPNVLYEDGHTEACEYWHGPTRLIDSVQLSPVLARCLTHSPVISVLDRETVIHACKEAEQTLIENESLQRQGMLLGTELVVYLRHVSTFKKWFYVDRILSSFGSHDGSGTIAAFNGGKDTTAALRVGYEIAKAQAAKEPPPYRPRILLVYSDYPARGVERERIELAEDSWRYHFDNSDLIELPVGHSEVSRSGADMGDSALPFIRDLFDIGCRHALPEDIVMYVNRDIGLTTVAPEKIIAGVARGQGVTVCPRRMLYPKKYRAYKTVLNCRHDGGFDVMAVTPQWWRSNRDKMPDMLIGREAWDTVFRSLAEEWADGIAVLNHVSSTRAQWHASAAYTDDVCWHIPHEATWSTDRTGNPGQQLNRKLARAFFETRGNAGVVKLIDSYERKETAPWVKPEHTEPKPRTVVVPMPEMIVSTRLPHNGEMAILIVDEPAKEGLLRACIKSVQVNASGFSEIVVVIPKGAARDYAWLKRVRVVEANGLRPHEICATADAIMRVDVSSIAWRPFTPADFCRGGKPLLVRERFADMKDKARRVRQETAEAVIGLKLEYDCSVRHPSVHVRQVYEKATKMGGRTDTELGAIAIAHFRDRYACSDYSFEFDRRELGLPASVEGRYIYRRDRDFIVEVNNKSDADTWMIPGRMPGFFVK